MIYKTSEGKEIELFSKTVLKDLKVKEKAGALWEKIKGTDWKQKAAEICSLYDAWADEKRVRGGPLCQGERRTREINTGRRKKRAARFLCQLFSAEKGT